MLQILDRETDEQTSKLISTYQKTGIYCMNYVMWGPEAFWTES